MVMAANMAGVRYVAGERIGPLVEVPVHIHKYSWEDMWRDSGIKSSAPAKNQGAVYKDDIKSNS